MMIGRRLHGVAKAGNITIESISININRPVQVVADKHSSYVFKKA